MPTAGLMCCFWIRSRRGASAGSGMRLLPSLLLLPAFAASGQSVQILVQSSPLAGFRYADAAAVMPQMQPGDALDLVHEADNPHDANAVRVEWRGRKLGYVPRRQNAAIAWG